MNTYVFSYFALIMFLLPFSMGIKATIPIAQHTDFYQAIERSSIDVFTQKGGKGYTATSPSFCLEDELLLYANVTYNEWPEQNKDVTFQISDPQQNFFILFGRTNMSGIATKSFRLPSLDGTEDIFGTWKVMASVDIAGVVVVDTLEFQVWWNLADVNHDLEVDIYDVVLARYSYGSTPLNNHWNPHCDVAELYGIIDIYDIVILVNSYGKKYNL